MKIAVVYNRESQSVINLFGIPNREHYGIKAIKRISDALRAGGHQVITLEGDKDLIDRLEEFMPRVLKGERPGMVFNLSYGIQGQARYTHVPGILEMVGVPYVGSGPLAHSLSLDKVVAKMIFQQHGIPTPDFVVLQDKDFIAPKIEYPLIVKPKNESTSFGIQIVHNEKELRSAAEDIIEHFMQPVLAESFIEGREINVGILGNKNPLVFEPAELIFGKKGPRIYTYEDKTRKSGREIGVQCPAKLSPELKSKAKEIALKTFEALGCFDCARVDLRLDKNNQFYVLEVNSLPSLGEHGSYVAAAEAMGMDFTKLVNQLVEVASIRYFGTPKVEDLSPEKGLPVSNIFQEIVQQRDRIEKRLKKWVNLSSRTGDMVGIQHAAHVLNESFEKSGLHKNNELSDGKNFWVWESKPGFKNGILLVSHLDVPVNPNIANEPFRLTPESLYGEGIGSSRAPLVMLETSMRILSKMKLLKKLPLGVVCYGDEGQDCVLSEKDFIQLCRQASSVLVLQPGIPKNDFSIQRRGHRRYKLVVDAPPRKLGEISKKPDLMATLFKKLAAITTLTSKQDRIAVAVMDIKTESFPFLRPHRVTVSIHASFPDNKLAENLEKKINKLLHEEGIKWHLSKVSERPAMTKSSKNAALAAKIKKVAKELGIQMELESSVWPSVAGLVPETVPVVCGLGPVATNLNTSEESVTRLSLVQRILVLTEFLARQK